MRREKQSGQALFEYMSLSYAVSTQAHVCWSIQVKTRLYQQANSTMYYSQKEDLCQIACRGSSRDKVRDLLFHAISFISLLGFRSPLNLLTNRELQEVALGPTKCKLKCYLGGCKELYYLASQHIKTRVNVERSAHFVSACFSYCVVLIFKHTDLAPRPINVGARDFLSY